MLCWSPYTQGMQGVMCCQRTLACMCVRAFGRRIIRREGFQLPTRDSYYLALLGERAHAHPEFARSPMCSTNSVSSVSFSAYTRPVLALVKALTDSLVTKMQHVRYTKAKTVVSDLSAQPEIDCSN